MKNHSFGHIPMVRMVLFYALGALTAITTKINIFHGYILIALVMVLPLAFAVFYLESKYQRVALKPVSGGILFTGFFLAGLLIGSLHLTQRTINNLPEDQVTFSAIIAEPPVEKDKSFLLVLKIDTVFKQLINVPLSAAAYIEKDEEVALLLPGDIILAKAYLNRVQAPLNPEQFNYQKYLFNQGIAAQTYIKSKNYKKIETTNQYRLKRLAHISRRNLLVHYQKNIKETENLAVLSALTLGYKDELDKATVSAFSASGAMHILAVSGLHVGIIYLILDSLLRFGRKHRAITVAKPLLSILILWAYAFITGLSPSVTRAVVMFSFLLIGKSLNRNINVYNNLAASAFFLLIADPFMIVQVGFQLSYTAVAGIVFFQPRIYRYVYFKNLILQKIWALVAVSIAAQLATLPFALYYFHQFPTYFFLTNILVIPLAYAILFLAVIFFSLSIFDEIQMIVGKLLEFVTNILNKVVSYIEYLPGSTIPNLHLEWWEFMLLAALIVLFAHYLYSKKGRVLVTMEMVFIVLLISFSHRNIKDYKTEAVIVFHSPGHRALLFLQGREAVLYLSGKADLENMGFNTEGYLGKHKINISDTLFARHSSKGYYLNNALYFMPSKKADLTIFGDKRILLLNDYLNMPEDTNEKLSVDMLLPAKVSSREISGILNYIDTDKVILDASTGYYAAEQLKNKLGENNISFHHTAMHGAFISE